MVRFFLTVSMLIIFNSGTTSSQQPPTTKDHLPKIEQTDSIKYREMIEDIIIYDTLTAINLDVIQKESKKFDKRYNNLVKTNEKKDKTIEQLQKEKKKTEKEVEILITENSKLKDSLDKIKVKETNLVVIDSICIKRKGLLRMGRCIEWGYVYENKGGFLLE